MSLVTCSTACCRTFRRTLLSSHFCHRFTSVTTIKTPTSMDADKSTPPSRPMWHYGASIFLLASVSISLYLSRERLEPYYRQFHQSTGNTAVNDDEEWKTPDTSLDNTDDDSNDSPEIPEPTESSDIPGPHNNFGEESIENDPYAELPEEDEPTLCSICNTFRQGPCRKYWRKTERCWKDNSDSEKCIPYSVPFINCSRYYMNLYHLITMNNFQIYVKELEDDTESVRIHQFTDTIPANNYSIDEIITLPYVNIDWNSWIEFNQNFGPSFSQTIPMPSSADKKEVPLWKRYPPDIEPILIPCSATLPKHYVPTSNDDADNIIMILDMAYITDQDGFLISKFYKRSVESDHSDEETKVNSDTHLEQPNETGLPAVDEEKEETPIGENGGQNTDFGEVSEINDKDSTERNDDSGNDGDGKLEDVEDDMDIDKTSNQKVDTTIESNDDNIGSKEVTKSTELDTVLLPGETKSIIVTAYYTKVDLNDISSSDSSQEEATMVFKKRFDLSKVLGQ